MRSARLLSFLPFVPFALALTACGADDGEPASPFLTRPEAGVRREVFEVDGVHAADAPSGATTPTEFEVTTVVRYRQDTRTPVPASAIVVAMPGFLAGASTFDGLARTLVRRGAARGVAVEVWAIDRRANMLEDDYGLELAEARRDPELAASYYRDLSMVEGRVFADFRVQADVRYLSEWGLAVHAEDLRRVVGVVPADQRRSHVFLLGHSLGGSFAEAYAAWRFPDGTRGADELAGIVLVDGILGDTPSTETEYLQGSMGAGFPMPGLVGIRGSTPYVALPVLGVQALLTAEILGLRARFAPDAIVDDGVRDDQFRLLFGYAGEVPDVTNAAALGLAFDSEHEPLPFVRATLGKLQGPTVSYSSLFSPGPLQRPSDPAHTYTFVDGPTQPGEYASTAALAEAMVDGRSNLAEWYFPARLALDLAASGGANLAEDGYAASYGLRTFDGELDDAPVLCVVAELVGSVDRCEAVRGRVAPTLGAGRPQAGQGRGTAGQDAPGFRVLDVTSMAHIDPVLATDHAFNPVPETVEMFLDEHRGAGTVVVPAMLATE